MARGRRRKSDKPVAKSVSIPESLDDEITILLMDPLTGRTAYGAFSNLVTQLLSDWLEKKRR